MPLCFVALIPPEPLKEEISSLKEEIRQRYGAKRALRLPAHITLQPPFKIGSSQLPVLHDTIREFARTQQPLEVELEGFGAFAPRVIFIEVANPPPLKKLQKGLLKVLEKEIFPGEEPPREFHPHITLATRDLSRNNFKPAWDEFRNRQFKKSFTAAEIYLFQHNGKTWDIIMEFKFGS